MPDENEVLDATAGVPPEEDPAVDMVLPPEVLEGIPPEQRSGIQRAFSASLSMMRASFPMSSPIANKITSEHIDKIIDNTEAENQREYQGQTARRWFSFASFLVILVVAVGLIVFLTREGQPEILVNLVIAIFAFGGGFGVGKAGLF